ncbi:MAG: hypothetical protein HOV94_14965, partial [Saccharothrix sp.]|nr:hypothetical protein [Saccharothrix sp.]
MTSIRELRVLPPLAVGRLGAAAEPMDNYSLDTDPEQPLAPRRLRPAPPFRIDPASGAITGEDTPAQLRFTDGHGKVRPVAPFLEVWALTDDDVLRPLTTYLLEANGLTPEDVRWCVQVGNHKIQRRTYDDDDRIDADTGWFHDHAEHPLDGRCAHFLEGKTLPLGRVRYLKPTPEFPGVRLRFTPAGGHVYGAAYTDRPNDPDPNVVDFLYDATKGRWRGHADQPGDPKLTIPANIYAGDDGPNDSWVSRGYMDDECDGLVHVRLRVQDRELAAFGRIGAG